jgi:hypothetical protein
MGERIDITIEVDDSDLQEAKADVEEFETESQRIIENVDQETKRSFNQVLSLARGAYLVGLGMVKAGGESVSYFFRAMISSFFGAVSILQPLLQAILHAGAATLNPYMVAQAVLGLASLGVSIGAAVSAEAGNQDLARGLRGLDMTILGFQQLINQVGDLYFI